MRRILRTLPGALLIASLGAFGTFALSGCDELTQDSQEQQQEQPERQQNEQPPVEPSPQP